MAEATTKKATEYTAVTMTDGRVVQFAGKRKVLKETIVDKTKIEADGGVVQFSEGAVAIRMDFRNGETRTLALPASLLADFAGHGAEQKFGDELASSASDPMSEDDMVLAIDDLYSTIAKGEWSRTREGGGGGGVAGASIVLRAIMEVNNVGRPENGKPLLDIAAVKTYINGLLEKEATKPEAERLGRRDFYKAFRNPATALGKRIKELEDAKAAKSVKVDGEVALAGL